MKNNREPVLKIEKISKEFGQGTVLDKVSAEFYAGEVAALVGPNGCGKTTLVKIIAGAQAPDKGEMFFDGGEWKPKNPREAIKSGIGMVYQQDTVAQELTGAENILLGNEKEGHKGAAEVVRRISAKEIDLRKRAELLSGGQKKSIEIARALFGEPKVMIFDEPTNSLGAAEQEMLFGLIERLKEEGALVIYISHKASEIMRLADRVIGMRKGKTCDILKRGEFDEGKLAKIMMGEETK